MVGLLSEYLSPYRRPLLLVAVLLLVQTIGNLYLPELNADIINNGVATGDTAYIVTVGGWMLAVSLVVAGTAVVSTFYSARTAMAFGRDVRADLFSTVQTFSRQELTSFGAPTLITRNTNDVQQLQMLVVMGLTVMLTAPIMCVGGIVMALRQDLALSWLLVVIVPLMAVVIVLLMSRALPMFRSMQVKIDRVNQVLREQLSGIRVIRAFVKTRAEEDRFVAANSDLTATALGVNRLFALMMPSLMLIMNLSGVAVIWFGGQRVDAGQMPIGNLTAFLMYMMQILMSVLMATMMFAMVPRAAASAERVAAVLDVVPGLIDVDEPSVPERDAPRGHVEFREVEFRYPGAAEPVLQDVSFSITRGETTAVVGSTGSGKTTLASLVPRLFDATAGSVLVDGVDVRSMTRDDLWARIGLVPQRSFLFAGTIASNLRFGRPDATDDELWHALGVAQAADFVRTLPEGLDAPIDQGGANVSGGQRQRLAIARALVRRPEIYLFDDSFSALDFATDARLRAALRPETTDATVLIVAQRVSTIMHADRIVVLDGGLMVGIGRHAELMETCPTYREIVLSQISEDEAA